MRRISIILFSFSLAILLMTLSCRKKQFKTAPEGYEELNAEVISKYAPVCIDTNSNSNINLCDTFRRDLINCQGNFDFSFPPVYGPLCSGLSRPDFPPIDFSSNTLVIGSFPFRGEHAGLRDTKVFVNRPEKKIIIRGLVGNSSGGAQASFIPAIVIDKVGSDYTITNEVINPYFSQ